MNSPLDALRLTIPLPTASDVDLGKLLSVKNWTVGTLLDAIVARNGQGQPVLHILRNGVPQNPALPLPENMTAKTGELLSLRVVQIEPRVQLQIHAAALAKTTAPMPAVTTPLANPLPSAKLPLPLHSILATPLPTPTNNEGSMTNAQNNTTTLMPLAKNATIDPSTANKWLANLSPVLRSPNNTNTSVSRWQTASWQDNTVPAFLLNRLALPTFAPPRAQERAQLLLSAFQAVNKVIWPQQRELQQTLPDLLPPLSRLATVHIDNENEELPTPLIWRARVAELARSVMHSIPNSQQLIENDSALPTPIKQWFRQWLQHQFSETNNPNGNTTVNTRETASQPNVTTTPLLRLLQALQSPPSDGDADAFIKTAIAPPTITSLPDDTTAEPKIVGQFANVSLDKRQAEIAGDLMELESLVQTVIARLQHHTISSVQQEARGQLQWSGELPVLHQQRCDVFDLRVEADHTTNTTIDTGPPRFVIRLRFDLPELGPCQFIVQLQGDAMNVNVYSEHASTQQKFADAESTLAQWLSKDALQLNAMECFTISNLTERMR